MAPKVRSKRSASDPNSEVQTKMELKDKVPENAHTVFVGINPAIRSAQVGHYYAHPSNKFWQLLTESGIAPRPVTAVDDDWMTTQGFGFTDVIKRPTVGVGDVGRQDLRGTHARLAEIMTRPSVQTIVFVSKFAARAFLNVSATAPIEYGEYRAKESEGPAVWFVPSTSGQSYRDSSYQEKLAVFCQLSDHLNRKPGLVKRTFRALRGWP